MKNKLSNITICLLLIVLTYSCEKEEHTELVTDQSRSIILEDISVKDVKHPYKVSGLLSNFSTTTSNVLQRKSSEATQDDFIIDTTSVKYMEGPVSHSYTFTVKSTDINPNVVQNLVLAKHNDMDSYISLIYTYNLTDGELLLIEQGDYPIEYVNEPIVESVEGFAGLLGRGPCVFYETVGFEVLCSHLEHQAAHADGTCTHPETTHITVTVQKDCPGSPSNTDDDIDYSITTSTGGGGGSGTNWGGNPNNNLYDPNHPDYEEVNPLEQGPLTQISLPMRSKLRNEMISLIDLEDLSFLNNYYHLERAFNMYLSTNNNTEGYAFVDWSIDYLQHLYLSGNSDTSIPASVPENAAIFNDIVHNNLNDKAIVEDLLEPYYIENSDKFIEDLNFEIQNEARPIEDINTFLDCFNDGKEVAFYSYILYVDQPVNGTRNVFNYTEQTPGHTFFTLIKTNVDDTSVSQTIGFYPANNDYKDGSEWDGPGVFQDNGFDDDEHDFDMYITFTIFSDEKFQDIISDIQEVANSDYDLDDNNCTNVAHNLAADNLDFVMTPTTSVIPILPGAESCINPGDYGEDLRDMYNDPNNAYSGSIGFKINEFDKPSTSDGPCN